MPTLRETGDNLDQWRFNTLQSTATPPSPQPASRELTASDLEAIRQVAADQSVPTAWEREYQRLAGLRPTPRQYPKGSSSPLKWYCEVKQGKVKICTGKYGELTRELAMQTCLKQHKEERASVLSAINSYLTSIDRYNKNIQAVSELLASESNNKELVAEPARGSNTTG